MTPIVTFVGALIIGATLGILLTWLVVRAGYAARLAAADAEREGLKERLQDLTDRVAHEDEAAMALAPLTSALARVERQVGVLERDRAEQFGVLGERLGEVNASTRALREQTATLAGSLNASSVRGLWGETQLRRVLEHSGMLARCDFEEQVRAVSRHEAQVRPDVVVRLPGEKVLVIDAKAPLSAFLDAQRPDLSPADRQARMAAHAKAFRRHVYGLADKDYWSAFETSPRLVVCFVPNEAVLAAAVEHDPELFEAAMRRHVAIASPATLLAVLRTSAHAWQQDALTSNARELLVLGRELHERLATLGTHVTRMGSSLRRSVETYNAMVGTLESRVLVTSRKLHELDLAPEAVPAPPPVDLPTRPLTAAELIENTALENTALENTALEGCDLERDARHVRDTVTDARPLGRRADSA
ncbi:DNA recombination protein RmuC [Kineosphaera limosa]|uniref:DNA recombination protein RmuC n=1 Tax=Kineosphaera limosa NBRC 100340 TaxID=1184609 RepID=K6XB66_9MICO|nr:DNA recombination protein RmuC [Kineosphaera limosa]NYE02398.1 DNA recombination protein RmuC [Kineosphaera limosa]GAB96074.1 hypothetical protein KILIM_031_00460 [Kineosphaera limosa NBRC 100340]